MFERFKRYLDQLLDAEKRHFTNGEAVRLGAGHNMVDPQWQYGLFQDNDGASISIFRWHSFFPSHVIPGQEITLTSVQPDAPLAKEVMRLIEKGDQRPYVNI